MQTFKVQMIGSAEPLTVRAEFGTLTQLGEAVARKRFLGAYLVEENGAQIDPPVEVMIPANRIHLVSTSE